MQSYVKAEFVPENACEISVISAKHNRSILSERNIVMIVRVFNLKSGGIPPYCALAPTTAAPATERIVFVAGPPALKGGVS